MIHLILFLVVLISLKIKNSTKKGHPSGVFFDALNQTKRGGDVPRQRSPNRDKAYELWKESEGTIELIEIAKQLDIPEGTIRGWKNKDDWNGTLQKNTERSKKHGGQPGNKNAVGHGAPVGNKNAEKHGFFSKWLPEDTLEIMEAIESKSSIDLLWDQIMLQYTAILRAQQIMYVRDKDDLSKETSMEGEGVTAWDVQQAWDKQARFLQAQSTAMKTLNSMIKQYDELLRSDLVTEEQQARINRLKLEMDKAKGETASNPLAEAAKRMALRRGEQDGQ